jgi:hypothetical protein
VNFQDGVLRPALALTALVTVATFAFAGCGGGSGGSSIADNCLSGGYGGGGGNGGGGTCGGNPAPTPTTDPQAQPVSLLLTDEDPVTVATYGQVLGYSNGTSPNTPNGSNVVNLTAGMPVQFTNREASTSIYPQHTASSLGAWSGSFPANGPTSAALTASPANTSLGASGFTTGTLNPGQTSAVYNSGSAAMIVFGCYYHYNSNNMRTVVIVM